jgi:hypothetical protein
MALYMELGFARSLRPRVGVMNFVGEYSGGSATIRGHESQTAKNGFENRGSRIVGV